ncbi:hypothetical protein WDH52_19445 [Streptomyces sp. TRM70308]|uniref:hypothetical protein n=1 Tax=Streptomyces sp. TRM70308 TaxID=3131932 RepID=UPI003D015304
MGPEDDHLSMPTHERQGSLVTSQASARRLKAQGSAGSELGQRQSVPPSRAQAVVEQ